MIEPVAAQDILSQAMSFAADVLADQVPKPFRAAFFVDMPRGELAIVPLMEEVDRSTMLSSAREFVNSRRGSRFALAIASPETGKVEQIHLTFIDSPNEPCHFLAHMVERSGKRSLGPYSRIDEASDEIIEVLGELLDESACLRPS